MGGGWSLTARSRWDASVPHGGSGTTRKQVAENVSSSIATRDAGVRVVDDIRVRSAPRLLAPSIAHAEPRVPATAQVYFDQTGQAVSGPFLAYWLLHQDKLGLPVNSVIDEAQGQTQWFEYGELVLRGMPFDQATENDITQVEVGTQFADDVGYSNRLDAFVPKKSGAGSLLP